MESLTIFYCFRKQIGSIRVKGDGGNLIGNVQAYLTPVSAELEKEIKEKEHVKLETKQSKESSIDPNKSIYYLLGSLNYRLLGTKTMRSDSSE